MDTRETLSAIAKSLPGLPPETVESTLMSFETLVHFGNPEHRLEAAGYLRDAAALCQVADQKDRLMRAADSVAAEETVARTPDGLNWQQAAAAQTIAGEDWVEPPEPVYPEPEPEEEEEEEEEEEKEDIEPDLLDEEELEELEELDELEDD